MIIDQHETFRAYFTLHIKCGGDRHDKENQTSKTITAKWMIYMKRASQARRLETLTTRTHFLFNTNIRSGRVLVDCLNPEDQTQKEHVGRGDE